MPLVATASLVAAGPVAAFNVITLEHAEAIALGASRAGRPALLQVSENAVRYHASLAPLAAACVAVASACPVPLGLHLDHVTDESLLHQAADCGFSSAMFDASTLPYDANVSATASAVEWAHANGLWLESELGEVGGKDGAHAPGVRTDPAEAATYVTSTGVDALAVAVGSSHAMTSRSATLDLSLIAALRDAVPVPLVLHGSSGVPDAQLSAAVVAGIVKVNIGTALNVSFSGAVRASLADDEAMVDPRKYLGPGREAMDGTVAAMIGGVSGPPPSASASGDVSAE